MVRRSWREGTAAEVWAAVLPCSSGPALVVFSLGELEVVPGHALVVLTGIAEPEGRGERGDEDRRAVLVDAPAQLADRLLRAQQGLGGHAAEREDHLG